MHLPDRRYLSRREYLRRLVAVGGAASLAACMDDTDEADVPSGDPDQRPGRQHDWNEALRADDDGNDVLVEHHVLVPLRLVTKPDEETRGHVETAFQSLERA